MSGFERKLLGTGNVLKPVTEVTTLRINLNPFICDLKQFLDNSFKNIHKTQLYCLWKSVEPAYPLT